jgi:uncharacterized protein (DUF1697 family)
MYIAFLRGLNVGGHRVKMDRLRSLFEDLGFKDVSTFIASGNVVFYTDTNDVASLRDRIQEHLAKELGYEVATFLRTPAALAKVAEAEDISYPSHHVIFLQEPASKSLKVKFADLEWDFVSFEFMGGEIHWRIKGKMSDSPLLGGGLEKAARGTQTTMRNMNTIRRIVAKITSSERNSP